MKDSLLGGAVYRTIVFMIGILAVASVIAPLLFVIIHRHTGIEIYWGVEQFIVMLLKFDDTRSKSIKTEFSAKDYYASIGCSTLHREALNRV